MLRRLEPSTVQRLRTCRGCRGVEPGLADLAIAVVVALDGERYPDECDAREDGEQDDQAEGRHS